MANVNLSTDAFRQSPHSEFSESPKHDRGADDASSGEAFIPKSFTQYGKFLFCTWVRSTRRPSDEIWTDSNTYASFAISRFTPGLLRTRKIYHNPSSSWPPYGVQNGTEVSYHYTKWGATESDHGSFDNPAASPNPGIGITSNVIVTKSDNLCESLKTYDDGVTIQTITDEPYTYVDALADAKALYTTKQAAWEASTTNGLDERWTYDTSGAIVAGEQPSFAYWGPDYPMFDGFGWGSLGSDTDTSQIAFFSIITSARKFMMDATFTPPLSFTYKATKRDYTANAVNPGTLGAAVTIGPIADGAFYHPVIDLTTFNGVIYDYNSAQHFKG